MRYSEPYGAWVRNRGLRKDFLNYWLGRLTNSDSSIAVQVYNCPA